MRVKILNGPNLNFIGIREKNIYGHQTYDELVSLINRHAKEHAIVVDVMQSNHEGILIDAIQQAHLEGWDAIIINPGAYTHYSFAIRDALASVDCLIVEVHLSNINEREAFRQVNVIRDVVDHYVLGKGFQGYIDAIDYIVHNNK